MQVKYPSRRRKNVSVSFPPKEQKTETRRSGSRFSASRSGNEVLRRGVSARAIRGLRAQLVVPDVHGLRDGRRARRLPSVKETIPHLGSRSLLSQQMTISLYESQPCGMCICITFYCAAHLAIKLYSRRLHPLPLAKDCILPGRPESSAGARRLAESERFARL